MFRCCTRRYGAAVLLAAMLNLNAGIAGAEGSAPPSAPQLAWRFEEELLHGMKQLAEPGSATVAVMDGPLGRQLVNFEHGAEDSKLSDFKRSLVGKLAGINVDERVRVNGLVGPGCSEVIQKSFRFSADDEHYFYVARIGKQWHVVRDTSMGPAFDMIAPPGAVLDRDGKHFAYVGMRGDQSVLVVDGVPTTAYFDTVRTPSFTNNGRHLIWAGKRGGSTVPMIDDRPISGCEGFKFVRASESGDRVGCVVERDGRWCVVVNGERGAEFDSILPSRLAFGPDGRRVGYPAKIGSGWHPVVDRVVGSTYDEVRGPYFSDDGENTVFKVRRDRQWSLVWNGTEGPWFEAVGWEGKPFSADGRHILYLGVRGEHESFVVMDTVAGPAYENTSMPIWSPQQTRYACRLRRGTQSWALIDGQPGTATYDAIDDRNRYFSPDGSRIAYIALKDKMWWVVTDSATFGPYAHVNWRVAFSPDSRHWAIIASRKSGLMQEKVFAVVDGQRAGEEFDTIVANGPSFLPDGTLEFLAFKNQELRRLRYHPTP